MSDFVKETLQRIRSKLLDLTRRNRLLNFKESARSIRVVDELPDEVFRILVLDGKEMEFIPLRDKKVNDQLVLSEFEDPSIPNYNEKQSIENELPQPCEQVCKKHRDTRLQTPFIDQVLERRCKKLLQESRTAIEETGSNMLYMAIGFLEWYEAEESTELNRAPLILVPVRIERSRIDPESNCYTYLISYTGEDIETNLSLAEKLSQDFDLILPLLDDDVLPEDYFEEVTKVASRRPKWHVAREIVLGLFSFSKLLMYRDLDSERWPTGMSIIDHPNISKVLGGRQDCESGDHVFYSEEYDIDNETRSKPTPIILDADSSQSSVILDAIHNKENLVVEGPPGTGKSQTITNLIAAALYHGLTVLFVAEKKAALEVVRSRLNHAGLGDFCLELHSHKTQKGQLLTDINHRLRKTYRDISSLDMEINDLVRERDRLLAYSDLVNTHVGPSGETINDIFWAAERAKTELIEQPLNIYVNNALQLTRDQINDRVYIIQDVLKLRSDLTDDAIHCWCDFHPGAVLPGDELHIDKMLEVLEVEIDNFCKYMDGRLTGISWPIPVTMENLRMLGKAKDDVLLEMPDDYHQDIANKFSDPENLVALEKLDSTISVFKLLLSDASIVTQSIEGGDATKSSVQTIADESSNLEKLGYGEHTLHELITQEEQLTTGIDLLVQLYETVESVQDLFSESTVSLVDYNRIFELKHVLTTLPAGAFGKWQKEHVLEVTLDQYYKVRNACHELKAQLNDHEGTFLTRYLPDLETLINLARGLRSYQASFFAFFNSKYRSLRRTAKGLLVNPKSLKTQDFVERLEKLIDTLKALEEVQHNEQYREEFGSLYCGIETDWDKLEALITWGQALAKAVGSQFYAYNRSSHISEQVPLLVSVAEAIGPKINEINELRGSLGIDMTHRVTDTIKQLKTKREQLQCHLKPLRKFPKLLTVKIRSLSSAAQSYLSSERLIENLDDAHYRVLLGNKYRKMDTDTGVLLKTARWVRDLHDKTNFPKSLISWLIEKDTVLLRDCLEDIISASTKLLAHYDKFVENLNKFGDVAQESLFSGNGKSCTLNEFREKVSLCRETVSYLVTLGDYQRTLGRAKALGLQQVTEAIVDERINPGESAKLYHHAVYDSMSRELIRRHPELASFTRAWYEGVRTRYAGLDRQIMKNTRERIAHVTSLRSVPPGIAYGPVKNHSDLALIEREVQKKKRHIPIRQLVRRSGKALQTLKPCFMMSPLSVAQYLEPGEITFDLIIMDEASQLRPEDSLGALARARQLIVVGDPNQLPPTSFFDRADGITDEEEETAAIQDTESILDICLTSFRKRRLRWHYRSEHESLIAFSNKQFYDEDLIIFPSPIIKNRNYGVHRHFVEGATYIKGRNRVEAEAVALAVVEHFRSQSKLSLGVAAFNREQAELILDVLDRMQKKNSWLEEKIKATESKEEPFFVKNLENVQGDERDVIFVSTTYGPDLSTGKVFQRFGPIANDTGWRRLNVIFTRAKKRLELFTSLHASDIKLTEKPSKGTHALKAYLEYAETGILPEYGRASGREPDSDFEIAVAHHLNINGFKTVAQVGVTGFFIDIGVLHPEREDEFILGVECDGAAYHSARSVRDRDRLRQEILERKGWRIHRIWSTDWFKNRDREIERLLKSVRQAIEDQSSIIIPKDDTHVALEEKLNELIQKSKTPVSEFESENEKMLVQTISKGLREELLEYRQANIIPNFPDLTKGILRDEILERLARKKPTTRDEFYKAIPIEIREQTDGKQMQYLEDILEIIDAYSG